MNRNKMDYVIIGNCAACVNAIEGIRSFDEKGNIRVITEEDYPAYCRCLISDYLLGTHNEEKLLLRQESFYKDKHVDLILGKKAVSVKPGEKKVILSDDKEVVYDRLLIATGSSPKHLGVEGEEKKGVFCFRTLEDARGIAELASKGGKVLVFGGGFIGLKAAYALKKRGVEVEVIVKSPQILSQILDADSSNLIRRWLEENGMTIRTGLGPSKILGNGEVTGVLLDNGETIDCRIVIVGKGVRSNMDLLNGSGVKTHWGIVTNDYLRTNVEEIYAAGDVAETQSLLTGEPTVTPLWTCAMEQGRVAGMNMAGGKKKYPGSVPANSINFFGLPIISIGHIRFKKEKHEEKEVSNEAKYNFKKAFIKDNRLFGAVLVGNIENAGVYLALIRKKADISSVRSYLLEAPFDYGKVTELLEGNKGFRESISLKGDLIRMA
jgi:NAD(P)H-nitrite reductase large subunit